MAGKISQDQLFEAEKKLHVSERIVQAMTSEERSNPELIVAMVHLSCYLCFILLTWFVCSSHLPK